MPVGRTLPSRWAREEAINREVTARREVVDGNMVRKLVWILRPIVVVWDDQLDEYGD